MVAGRTVKMAFLNLFRISIHKDCSVQEIICKASGTIVRNLNFSRNLNDWEVKGYVSLLEFFQNGT